MLLLPYSIKANSPALNTIQIFSFVKSYFSLPLPLHGTSDDFPVLKSATIRVSYVLATTNRSFLISIFDISAYYDLITAY